MANTCVFKGADHVFMLKCAIKLKIGARQPNHKPPCSSWHVLLWPHISTAYFHPHPQRCISSSTNDVPRLPTGYSTLQQLQPGEAAKFPCYLGQVHGVLYEFGQEDLKRLVTKEGGYQLVDIEVRPTSTPHISCCCQPWVVAPAASVCGAAASGQHFSALQANKEQQIARCGMLWC